MQHHLDLTFQEPKLNQALGLLLGLPSGMEGQSTAERRKLAASTAGYAESYFARRLEGGYLEELKASLLTAHLARGAEGTFRSAVDRLIQTTGIEDSRFIQQALDCGLAPLLRVTQYPEEVRRDFQYRCELEAGAEQNHPVYRVRGEYASVRSIPNPKVEVVVCRTLNALRSWFDQPTVVSAEYAPLPVDAWRQMVAHPSHLESRVVIDGNEAEPLNRAFDDEYCSTTFSTEASVQTDSQVKIYNRYMHDRSCREMTIRLRNHFCFGSFEVELLLDDPEVEDLSIYDYIAGVDAGDLRLYGRSGEAAERDPGPYTARRHARVAAGPDAVIWPGSGVHISWRGS